MSPIFILALAICLACSAFFSASETSLFSLSSHDLFSFRRSKKPKERKIAALLAKPSDLLVTIMILNICLNILMQNVTAQIFASGSWLLTVILPLCLTLFCGEVIPKSTAYTINKRIALLVTPLIYRVVRAMRHITRRVSAITFSLSRAIFFFLKDPTSVSRTELVHVLQSSKQSGTIHGAEMELIEGVLQLSEVNVKEVMSKRSDVIYFDIDHPIDELSELIYEKKCSKLPVCRGSLDHVIGILTLEAYYQNLSQIKTSQDLEKILKRPLYIPEHLSAQTLFQDPRMRMEDIALVVDEYGFIEGLVTFEDIVEVIVGNILDERDQASLFTRVGENVIITSGRLEITQFERIFGCELDHSPDTVSIGGWLIDQLQEIPKAGQEFHFDSFIFHVLSAEPSRVRSLYIRRREEGR